jgi:myo-inositol-1(or 4)-monophosphatase
MFSLEKASESMQAVARKVGAMQRGNLGRQDLLTDRKSTRIDLVTEIDRLSDDAIVGFLQQEYPDHTILAEESGESGHDSQYRWVIDPLDGTTNYAQGLPIFAVSIALEHRQEPVLAIVYEPVTDEMFTAIRGQGAYLNGKRLTVGAKTELIDCVLATGFPYDIATHPVNNIDYFISMAKQVRAIRRMGAAAYDLACVASGGFDGFWEMALSPWDAAASVLLVKEAGGVVLPFRNDRKISIVAGNEIISRQILAVLRQVDHLAEPVPK